MSHQFSTFENLNTLFTYLGGKLRVKPTVVRLTKNEYDALTSAQKHDTTKAYYIYDWDPTPATIIDDTTTSTTKTWSSQKISQSSGGSTVSITTRTGTDTALGGQFITINNVETLINGTGWMEKTQTTSTSANNVFTFTNAAITADSIIDPYTNINGLYPKDIQLTDGQCSVIFDPYDSVISMSCKIYIK